jgi:ATP-dependent protease Clp ATPase subunit
MQNFRSRLDQEITSQSAAKEVLAHAVDLHRKRLADANPESSALPVLNLLLTGPSGTGKSALSVAAAVASGLPYHVAHMCDYAAPGQPGTQLEVMFQRLLDSTPQVASHTQENTGGIIILESLTHQASISDQSRALQTRLASFIEAPRPVLLHMPGGRMIEFSTSKILFIACATASQARTLGFVSEQDVPVRTTPESLLSLGLIRQLVEAFAVVPFSQLSHDDIYQILIGRRSPLARITSALAIHGLELHLEGDALEWLTDQAYESGKGGKGLESIVTRMLAPWLACIEELSPDVTRIVINREALCGMRPPRFDHGTPRYLSAPKATHQRAPGDQPEELLFPDDELPKRPARSSTSHASGSGRWASEQDLRRWLD